MALTISLDDILGVRADAEFAVDAVELGLVVLVPLLNGDT